MALFSAPSGDHLFCVPWPVPVLVYPSSLGLQLVATTGGRAVAVLKRDRPGPPRGLGRGGEDLFARVAIRTR